MTADEFLKEWHNGSTTMTVKTSGSTGKPKMITVEKARMLASARMTCDFLQLKRGDTALLCMPVDYIAGKMMLVRVIERGMRLVVTEPCGHPMKAPGMETPPDLVAMVPMQVYNTMQNEKERRLLMQARHLLIGGGAIDNALEKELRDFPNAVWSTYGMTETLSHIALRRLNGETASEWYTPFDTVEVSQNADGCLVIDAPEVCSEIITTNDIVEMAPDGRRFRITGRRDNVICSGGVKIQIEEVEKRLKEHLSIPFMITKCRDEKFGETAVMLYESSKKESGTDTCPHRLTENDLRHIAKAELPQYWQPRHYIAVGRLPQTETGKPARKEAELLAESFRFNIGEDTTAH